MRKDLSLENLLYLYLAWEAGEVSEGRMVELTGLDRTTLRGQKQAAIEVGIQKSLRTPEERAAFRRSLGLPAICESASAVETTTDPERFST